MEKTSVKARTSERSIETTPLLLTIAPMDLARTLSVDHTIVAKDDIAAAGDQESGQWTCAAQRASSSRRNFSATFSPSSRAAKSPPGQPKFESSCSIEIVPSKP